MVYFSPDTQTYIRKLEDERREKERGKGKDNRSFFAKYVSAFFLELFRQSIKLAVSVRLKNLDINHTVPAWAIGYLIEHFILTCHNSW